MKNTAPRVGVAGGAGGRRTRPPREAQGRKPRAGQGATLAPRARQKMSHKWRAFEAGAGVANLGQPHRGETTPHPTRKTPRQPKKTPGGTPLCRAKREPRRGVPAGAADAPAAGARQGQPPHKGGQATTTRRAIMLRQAAMGAKDNRQQGNEKGGSPQRQDQSGSNDAGHRAAGERSRPKKPTPTT